MDLLLTRGFGIGSAPPPPVGPQGKGGFVAVQVYVGGFAAATTYTGGAAEGDVQ